MLNLPKPAQNTSPQVNFKQSQSAQYLNICAGSEILLGKYDKAIQILQKVLKDDSQNQKALFRIICAYEMSKKYQEAIECCQQLLQINPQNQQAQFKLSSLQQEKPTHVSEQVLDMEPESMYSFSQESSQTQQAQFQAYKQTQNYANTIDLQQDQDQIFIPIAQIIQEQISKKENNKDSLLNKANLLKKQQKFQESVNVFTDLIEQNYETAQCLVQRGVCYDKLEQYDNAKLDFQQALQLDPKNQQILLFLSQCLLKLSDPVDSLQIIEQAIKINQNSSECIFQKGFILKSQKQFNLAIKELDKAISIEFQPKYIQLRAFCFSQIQSYQQSLKDYNVLLSHVQNAENYYNRAVVQLKLNDIQESTNDLKKSLELENSVQTVKALISNCITLQKFEEVNKYADKIFEFNGYSKENLEYRANIYKQLGQFQYALDIYLRLEDYSNIGYCNRKLGNFSQSVEFYSKLKSLSSKDLCNRAFCFARQELYQKAIEDYTKSIALEQNANSYFNRAICYQKLGKQKEAKEDALKCINLDPHNEQVKQLIKEL